MVSDCLMDHNGKSLIVEEAFGSGNTMRHFPLSTRDSPHLAAALYNDRLPLQR